MKRTLIFLFVLFIAVQAQAQVGVQKAELLGTWKVSKVEMIKDKKTLLVADKDTVVYSEAFVNSLKEEEKKMTFGILNTTMKLILETKIVFLEDDAFVQVNHKGKEFKGTYVLGKGGKKISTVVGEEKKTYSSAFTNNQLVLTEEKKDGQMILTYTKQ